MFQNYKLSTLVSKGFQQVAYITLQDEENIWRTFYNLLPIVSDFYFGGFFGSLPKKVVEKINDD